MSDTKQMLQRARERFVAPGDVMESLMRRREKKERNRRISAAVLAIVLTLLSITGLMRAFRNTERPAIEPTPTPVDTGIFSGLGGWIAYGLNAHEGASGIWAMDSERPEIRKQLSTYGGRPLAWASDGSKLLIRAKSSPRDSELYVLNADGSQTLLVEADARYSLSGGSFSPDGSRVVYAYGNDYGRGSAGGIYVVDADGGSPQRVLSARWYPGSVRLFGQRVRSGLMEPTFSPDGSQIAYVDGMGDHSNSLRVMSADGTGSRVLVNEMSGAFAGGLVWSPDGSRLAFGMGYTTYRIYVVGADGSGLTLIAFGADPQWSPDGSRISFDKVYGLSPPPMVIADADGTHIQRFNNAHSGPWNPLDRAESGNQGTSVTAGATRPNTLIYAIAALAAIGIVVLWLRRKREKEDVT
jgi:dipeptidyl aminopeptidase/acylaminoacyl peptidase